MCGSLKTNEIGTRYLKTTATAAVETTTTHISIPPAARVLASQAEAIVRTGRTWPQATKWRKATKRRN